MKQMILKVSVGLLGFYLGIAATFFYFTRHGRVDNGMQGKQAEKSFTPACFPGLSLEINPRTNSSSSYFPEGIFTGNQRQNQFLASWYSKHLSAMDEPSLVSATEGEYYRFLWLRSFHRPIAVRIWRTGNKSSLLVKEMDGAGGYEPGKLVINETRPLTEAEWKEFLGLLDKSCYWQMPVNKEIAMTDGAQWILEGARKGRYHIVDRQSPESGDYREACLFLLKISGLKVPGEDVY